MPESLDLPGLDRRGSPAASVGADRPSMYFETIRTVPLFALPSKLGSGPTCGALMRPHFPIAEADRQIVFYINDCAESYLEGGGSYRDCGPSVEELSAHLGFDRQEIITAVERLAQQGFLTVDKKTPLSPESLVYPTPRTLIASESFNEMSQAEVEAFIGRLRDE